MSTEYSLTPEVRKTIESIVSTLNGLAKDSGEKPSKLSSLFDVNIDESLKKLLTKVAYCCSIESKVIIYALIIFDRLNSYLGGLLTHSRRKMTMATCLFIALKYNVDSDVHTEDYCEVVGVSVEAMNKAEKFAYKTLKFKLYVSEEEFLTYEENVC